MVDKNFYTTVLSQTLSPCGSYLVTGNTYGTVSVFDLSKIFNPNDSDKPDQNKPRRTFCAHDETVHSMATTDQFLITGTVGQISGWKWKAVTDGTKVPKPAWTKQLPSIKDDTEKDEVNSQWFDTDANLLYVVGGSNSVYVHNLESGDLSKTVVKHDDYIHCIYKLNNTLATASEDGSVKLWDLRQKEMAHAIYPHKNDNLERKKIGKWVGAVAINDDWMLCGGGPRLALWHLRSLEVTTVFDVANNGIHVAELHDDLILAGGASKYLYNLNYKGDISAEIPSSSTSVFSIVHQNEPYKMLSIAGSSYKIDLCTNFSYRDQILSLF